MFKAQQIANCLLDDEDIKQFVSRHITKRGTGFNRFKKLGFEPFESGLDTRIKYKRDIETRSQRYSLQIWGSLNNDIGIDHVYVALWKLTALQSPWLFKVKEIGTLNYLFFGLKHLVQNLQRYSDVEAWSIFDAETR